METTKITRKVVMSEDRAGPSYYSRRGIFPSHIHEEAGGTTGEIS